MFYVIKEKTIDGKLIREIVYKDESYEICLSVSQTCNTYYASRYVVMNEEECQHYATSQSCS